MFALQFASVVFKHATNSVLRSFDLFLEYISQNVVYLFLFQIFEKFTLYYKISIFKKHNYLKLYFEYFSFGDSFLPAIVNDSQVQSVLVVITFLNSTSFFKAYYHRIALKYIIFIIG